jgi:Ferritin-like
MSQTIVELMKSTKRDLAWLQRALQSAIDLELSTLPPYLCGYWSLIDSSSFPAKQIKSIFYQEMLHFGLACNMLTATGKQPQVLKGYGNITYPGPLPGGVIPACDGDLIPCDPNFQVVLGFTNFHAFTWMAAQIEYPEDPVPRPALLSAAQTYPTIGQFYDAVLEAFNDNNSSIPYSTANQQQGPLGLYVVNSLTTATTAIQTIQQQGEGGNKNPYYAPNQLSHFYAFGQLYYLKMYVYNAATQTGDWNGAAISIPDVYNMTPVPLGGYPSPPAAVIDFDRAFTSMLKDLDAAWAPGGSTQLGAAIGVMQTLTTKAVALLKQQIPRTDAPGIYGPQFRINTSAPGGGGSGSAS